MTTVTPTTILCGDQTSPPSGARVDGRRGAMIAAQIEHSDFQAVAQVSQALSGEMVQERLIGTLLRAAIEQSGAERGLLVLWRSREPRIAAEATARDDTIVVHLRDEAVAESLLPESVLNYVQRTRESVVIDDAVTQAAFAADPYVRQHKARSILCLPLLNQAELVGALFLENHLAPGVFAPARIAALRLVSSLASVALENLRLRGELQKQGAEIRRLIDANFIGIYIIDLGGRIIEANDAFLGMVGYEREDLVAGRMRWTDLTPPEWRIVETERAEKVKMTGSLQPFEKEYFRKDGSRVPVLVGVARFEESSNRAVVFAIDLTKRKRAEAQAMESERRFRDAQMELAHANRVGAIGQLSASIGHEISQPLSGVLTNAGAASLWLKAEPPNIEKSLAALARIVRDGKRVSDVVSRIRALIKKGPPQEDKLDIGEAIREVVDLMRGESANNSVLVRTQLEDGLPLIEGDRVQLQQVILNLTMNAVEAMSAIKEGPREMLITTAKTETDVLVSVRDSGPGLDIADVERIFAPFYTTKPSGLGMGLSICRSIIEAHGGKLWAVPGVPRGAVLQFQLPCCVTP